MRRAASAALRARSPPKRSALIGLRPRLREGEEADWGDRVSLMAHPTRGRSARFSLPRALTPAPHASSARALAPLVHNPNEDRAVRPIKPLDAPNHRSERDRRAIS